MLPFLLGEDEIVVDNFAGGGGASTGRKAAHKDQAGCSMRERGMSTVGRGSRSG